MYQLISPQTIFQYFGDDDKEMLQEMIQIILDSNLKDLKDMDELYQAEDFALIKRRCHKAKPSLSYIGAIQTRKILESIEADLENSQEQFKHLLHDIEIIEKELHTFLDSL
ncbi:Hpt domain-containing protein [Aquiflexum gelatinilyticum]|uniref:Hpt domain-containing protein n=1 Tax=Aquiflexum gelatinilyticum TaxID=2961943 RepID=A0A9X2PBL6_9BACT|nr:Hpt domain-containing protein [Aquiflexum gelatinilyticum]MCR9015745.1 Hpt domain-containing protein [Aquiflexum gelatinilyticum]MCS4436206.1 Hpt domain-containing protein [Aquiflexum gelatinilyticum]